MESRVEIKPCQCGRTPRLRRDAHEGIFWVICESDDCLAQGPVGHSAEDAITAWNKPGDCIAELTAENQRLRTMYADAERSRLAVLGQAVAAEAGNARLRAALEEAEEECREREGDIEWCGRCYARQAPTAAPHCPTCPFAPLNEEVPDDQGSG